MMRNVSVFSASPGRKRRALILLASLSLLLVAGVLAASCSGGTTGTTAGAGATAGGGGSVQVLIKNLAFDPATVTISAGESVTWTNQDAMNHTVTADGGEFKSGDLADGAAFSFQFDSAGTYAYHCSIHPAMMGTVVVE